MILDASISTLSTNFQGSWTWFLGVKMPKYEPGKTLVGLYCICLVLPSFLPSICHPIHPHQTNFRHTFLKNCKGYKVETVPLANYTHTQWADVLYILESGQGPMVFGHGSWTWFLGVKMPKYEPGKTLVGLYCICLVLPSFLSSFLPSICHPIHPHETNFLRTFLKNSKGYKVETVPLTYYTHTQWADVLYILESGQGPMVFGV